MASSKVFTREWLVMTPPSRAGARPPQPAGSDGLLDQEPEYAPLWRRFANKLLAGRHEFEHRRSEAMLFVRAERSGFGLFAYEFVELPPLETSQALHAWGRQMKNKLFDWNSAKETASVAEPH